METISRIKKTGIAILSVAMLLAGVSACSSDDIVQDKDTPQDPVSGMIENVVKMELDLEASAGTDDASTRKTRAVGSPMELVVWKDMLVPSKKKNKFKSVCFFKRVLDTDSWSPTNSFSSPAVIAKANSQTMDDGTFAWAEVEWDLAVTPQGKMTQLKLHNPVVDLHYLGSKRPDFTKGTWAVSGMMGGTFDKNKMTVTYDTDDYGPVAINEDGTVVDGKRYYLMDLPLGTKWTILSPQSTGKYKAHLSYMPVCTMVSARLTNKTDKDFDYDVYLETKGLARKVTFEGSKVGDMSQLSDKKKGWFLKATSEKIGNLLLRKKGKKKLSAWSNGTIHEEAVSTYYFTWGFPTGQSDVAHLTTYVKENGEGKGVYGYSFLKKNTDITSPEIVDTVATQTTTYKVRQMAAWDVEIGKPKLPVEYFDKDITDLKYDIDFDTHWTQQRPYWKSKAELGTYQDRLFTSPSWITNFEEQMKCRDKKAVATLDNFSAIAPYATKSEHSADIFSFNQQDSKHYDFKLYSAEKFRYFSCDYKSKGDKVGYALYYRPSSSTESGAVKDNVYLAAYKYEYVQSYKDLGLASGKLDAIKLTVRYLGNSGSVLSLDDISNTGFWSNIASSAHEDIVYYFPFYGHYTGNGPTGTLGYYKGAKEFSIPIKPMEGERKYYSMEMSKEGIKQVGHSAPTNDRYPILLLDKK